MLPKIKHPVYSTTLPTTKKTVQYRPMQSREEKILLTAKQAIADTPDGDEKMHVLEALTAVKQVVNNCIVSQDVDVDHLSSVDIEWMFIQIRSMSVAPEALVAYIDNQDQQTRQFTVKLSDVEVKFPEKDLRKIEVAPGIVLEMKYPPASLLSDRETADVPDEDMIDYLCWKCIDKVYDGEDVIQARDVPREELMAWLDSLDLEATKKIKEFFENLPTLFYEVKYTNQQGTEVKIPLTSLLDFFIF